MLAAPPPTAGPRGAPGAPAASATPAARPLEQNLESTTQSDAEGGPVASAIQVLTESGGPRRFFSVDGYLARALCVSRPVGEAVQHHCLSVAWPPGPMNNDGTPCRVAQVIDQSWLRVIANTLERVPFSHVRALRRVVIDNRPKQHGIAAFDRNSPDDARDGHTIWLHEHLFTAPNHWAQGNYGTYWSYHLNQDRAVVDGLPTDHDLFSPVLLHELGHIVMYNLANRAVSAVDTPPCARTCGDRGNCAAIAPQEREADCISPYCMPFEVQAGTENWAEQYRFHYQSSATRALLTRARVDCGPVLAELDLDPTKHPAPWELGLPDIADFRRSLWKSCGGKACKAW